MPNRKSHLPPGFERVRAELNLGVDPEVLADLGYEVDPDGYPELPSTRTHQDYVDEGEPWPDPPPDIVDPNMVPMDDDGRPLADVMDITTDVPPSGTESQRVEALRRHPSSTEGIN